MSKIVEVKEGVLGNIIAIAFLLLLCGFTAWWGFYRDHSLLPISAFFSFLWLVGCYFCLKNILHPKCAFLAIDGERLVWSVRSAESSAATETEIPLSSLRAMEFVLPKMKFEVNSRNHTLAELLLIDIHGNRHQLPIELWPGVHRNKIVVALKTKLPNIQVIERVDDLIDHGGS